MQFKNVFPRPADLHDFMGFQVSTVASIKMPVFWVVAPCSLVEIHGRFRGYLPDDRGKKAPLKHR